MTVVSACRELHQSTAISTILETTLALGNFLNQGTSNGDAKAFDIEVLPKIIVSQFCL